MIDAYTWTTPNGQKLLIALEELAIPYKLHWVNIAKGEQNTPEFLAINPNNKIPALVDDDGPNGQPIAVFESGATLIYLAEKTNQLYAPSGPTHVEILQWMFFQAGGTGPMFGQLAHFAKFAPEKVPYAIDRYTKETQRLCKVLDERLGKVPYLATGYSIADIMNVTWVNAVTNFGIELTAYPNLARWHGEVMARPAVQRAMALKPS